MRHAAGFRAVQRAAAVAKTFGRYESVSHFDGLTIVVEWDGAGTPLAYVVSANLRRRHLTMGQRAMIAGRLSNIKHGQTLKHGPEVKILTSGDISAEQAAELMDVSRPQVFHARDL